MDDSAEVVHVQDPEPIKEPVKETRIARPHDDSTVGLVRLAMEQELDVGMIRELLELRQKERDEEARCAFVAAKAAFAAEAPTITKDKKASNAPGKYPYASIGNVVETSGPVLAMHGFGWNWSTRQEGDAITVTCRLTHERGHYEEDTMTAPPDKTGGSSKNPIQQVASTVSYLRRYTYLNVTGLAVRDERDDDARTAYSQNASGSAGRQDRPPENRARAKAIETIEAFARHLGEHTKADLERWLGVGFEQWGDNQYVELRKLWPKLKDGDEETTNKIKAARPKEGSDGQG